MKTAKIFMLAGKGVFAAAIAALATSALAADLASTKEPAPPPVVEPTPWFVKLGVAGVLFDSSASLSAGGVIVPGASARASDNVTALIEFGYFLSDNISAQITGGYPPTTTLTGKGTISALGTLGKATYGPGTATFEYHFTNFDAFRPYVGAGLAFPIIFSAQDGVVKNLDVKSAGGWVFEAGFDYYLNRNWSIFAEAKKIFVSVPANGNALGTEVRADVRLDPVIVSGGVGYHW